MDKNRQIHAKLLPLFKIWRTWGGGGGGGGGRGGRGGGKAYVEISLGGGEGGQSICWNITWGEGGGQSICWNITCSSSCALCVLSSSLLSNWWGFVGHPYSPLGSLSFFAAITKSMIITDRNQTTAITTDRKLYAWILWCTVHYTCSSWLM